MKNNCKMIAMNVTSIGEILMESSNKSANESELDFDWPYAQRLETYIVPVVFGVIFLVGTIGNSLVILIFLRHQSMRSVPNSYIFSLAIGDLLVILFCVPLALNVYIYDEWKFGGLLCKISEFAKDLSIGVSVFTLTALAVERFEAIVCPLKKKLQHRSRIVIIIVGIWSIAICFALPALIIAKVTGNDPKPDEKLIRFCSPFGDYGKNFRYRKYVTIVKATVYYFLPLSIIGLLYSLMARKLHKSAHEIQNSMASRLPTNKNQAKSRIHVARMVIVFILAFIICFLPYHIFSLWFFIHPTAEEDYDYFWHITRIVGFSMYFINSCVNPVALYFVSTIFRQYFHKYLCCKKFSLSSNFQSRVQNSTKFTESKTVETPISKIE